MSTGLILFIVGAVFVLIAVVKFLTTWIWLMGATTVPGTIIAYNERTVRSSSSSGPRYRRMFYPMIRFNWQGKDTEIESNIGSSMPLKKVGDTIEICYHPNNPSKIKIKSMMSLWFLTIFLILLGVFFGVIGYAVGGPVWNQFIR